MKKIVCVLLIMALFPTFSVNAAEENLKEYSIDPELGEILVDAFDSEERKLIQDKDIYYWNAKDLEILDQPIVKVYCSSPFRKWGDRPFNELITEAEKLLEDRTIIGCDYIIFDREPIIIHYGYMGGEGYGRYVIDIPGIPSTDPILWIQKSIQSLSATTEILGQSCKINNIVAFCGDDMQEQCLYVDTDKGVFVKYFDYKNQDGVWYEEETVREMIRSYLKECEAMPETSENLYGGMSANNVDDSIENISNTQEETSEAVKKTPIHVWLVVCLGLVALCFAVILLVFRKIFIFRYKQ